MKATFVVCLLSLAAVAVFFPEVVFSAAPIPSGYDFTIDVSQQMANTTPGVSDIPTPTYFVVYYKIQNNVLHLAVVCNGSAPDGTNVYSWCGFGFHMSDDPAFGMVVSDAVIGYLTPTDNFLVADMILGGRALGEAALCDENQICADEHRDTTGCQESWTPVAASRQDEYFMFEVTRPLSTNDPCDKPIVVGQSTSVVFSIGLVDNEQDPSFFPYNLFKHTHAANVYTQSYNVVFQVKPDGTDTQTAETQQGTVNTQTQPETQTTQSPQTSEEDKDSSLASTFSVFQALLVVCGVFALF